MNYQSAAALLGGWDNILILTHKRPDGDTIGSAVGLCVLLRQLGKRAWIHPNPEASRRLAAYFADYVAPEDFVYDKVVSVDVATVNLLTDEARAIYNARGIDLALDHHPSNELFARENCVEPDKAACGELIYKLVEELGELTDEMATPLYLALSTDTGCFVYANTTANTHAVAAKLLERNIPYRAINKTHFRTKSLKRLELEARLLQNRAELEEGKILISGLSNQEMLEIGATKEDREDLAAYLGQIEGVLASCTVKETEDGSGCKVSMRSDADFLDSCAVCALLGGGGHKAASGCVVEGKTLAEAMEVMANAIRQVRHGS